MATGPAQKRTRKWGDRLYQLLLDEYMDTVDGARRHGFQAWLVKASGVKRATIGTWWSSAKRPDLASLAKLRAALPGLTVTQMVAAIEGVEIELRSPASLAEQLVDLGPEPEATLPRPVLVRSDDEQRLAGVVLGAGTAEGARRDRNRAAGAPATTDRSRRRPAPATPE